MHFSGRPILCAVYLGLCSVPLNANVAPTMAADTLVQSAAHVELFMDSVMASIMAEHHVPGAVFVIVKDGRIILAKGYGQANVQSRQPVDAQKTLFRIASITKPFTAVAILQLVEQNLLSLDEDIREKLPITLETQFDGPITIWNLLTHTSGFELSDIGDAARSPEDVLPLAEMAATRMTTQGSAPGRRYHYSNHNYLLAGLLIEQATGTPYDQYLQNNVFRPLGMDYISAAQPIPDSLHANRAIGYDWSGDSYAALPLDFSNVASADVIHASGLAMARFMLALLDSDQSRSLGLFGHESHQLMTRVQFNHHSALQNGWTLGLVESTMNGLRSVGHGGAQLGFISQMHLFPEENLGIFVALNRRSGNARYNIVQAYLDRYYSGGQEISPLMQQPDRSGLRDLEHLAGVYLNTGFALTGTLEKVIALAGRRGSVRINSDGAGNLAIGDTRLLPRDGGVFLTESGRTVIYFEQEQMTGKTYLYYRTAAFEKISAWNAPDLHRGLLNLSLLLVPLIQIGWKIATWRRGKEALFGSDQSLQSPALKAAAAGSAALIMGWLGLFVGLGKGLVQLDYGVPGLIYLLLTTVLAGSMITLIVLYYSIQSWRVGVWHPLMRLSYSLVALGMMAMVAIAYKYNLLGYYIG